MMYQTFRFNLFEGIMESVVITRVFGMIRAIPVYVYGIASNAEKATFGYAGGRKVMRS